MHRGMLTSAFPLAGILAEVAEAGSASLSLSLSHTYTHPHTHTHFPFLLLSPRLSVLKSPLLELKYSQEQLSFGS